MLNILVWVLGQKRKILVWVFLADVLSDGVMSTMFFRRSLWIRSSMSLFKNFDSLILWPFSLWYRQIIRSRPIGTSFFLELETLRMTNPAS